MKARAGFVAGAVLWLFAFSLAGCGGDDLVIGGNLPPPTVTPVTTPTATCLQSGARCSFDSDCCSGGCSAVFGQCT